MTENIHTMKRTLTFLILSFLTVNIFAGVREKIWPKGKMPDAQEHQIAAMTDESGLEDFNPDKNRIAYIEWFDAPGEDIRMADA